MGKIRANGDFMVDGAVVSNGRTFVAVNGGNLNSSSASVTGAITIELPHTSGNHMVSFWADIYTYGLGEPVQSFLISGYTYWPNNTWVNCSCAQLGGNTRHQVRWTRKNGKFRVQIGEADFVWKYPQVQVRDAHMGHNAPGATALNPWLVTIESAIDASVDAGPYWAATAPHNHSPADINGLQAALDGKAATAHTHAWADITSGVPATFPPSAHTHDWADITGKPVISSVRRQTSPTPLTSATSAKDYLIGTVSDFFSGKVQIRCYGSTPSILTLQVTATAQTVAQGASYSGVQVLDFGGNLSSQNILRAYLQRNSSGVIELVVRLFGVAVYETFVYDEQGVIALTAYTTPASSGFTVLSTTEAGNGGFSWEKWQMPSWLAAFLPNFQMTIWGASTGAYPYSRMNSTGVHTLLSCTRYATGKYKFRFKSWSGAPSRLLDFPIRISKQRLALSANSGSSANYILVENASGTDANGNAFWEIEVQWQQANATFVDTDFMLEILPM